MTIYALAGNDDISASGDGQYMREWGKGTMSANGSQVGFCFGLERQKAA